MSVIENGIAAPETTEDLKRAGDAFRSEWNIPASDLLIGFLGRNDPMKGVEVLLEAFALVRKQLASVKLVIAGSGFAGISPRELVVDPEVGQNIRLVGVVDPWKGFLAAIDVLVSSSRYGEGFSNSVAEALLAGRAVVCTDSGDSRRIVGDFGQVVEPQNPKAIADGILLQASLATDPELSYQRRAWVEENFGVTRMVERHETAFFRLIAEH